jgi:adenosylhomocysteinase
VTVKDILNTYIEIFPEEKEGLVNLIRLVDGTKEHDMLSPNNYTNGHITISGFVLYVDRNEKNAKVLMRYHQRLKEYLQPGGGVKKKADGLLDAVLREIEKDTGIVTKDLEYLPFYTNPSIPVDIDIHEIRATQKEPQAHLHFDFRYVFRYKTETLIIPESSEQYKWENLDDLKERDTYKVIVDKIKEVLSRDYRPKIFFMKLLEKFADIEKSKVNTLIVAHFLPDVLPYLETLHLFSNIIGIIPKPKSKNKVILDKLKKANFNVIETNRMKIKDTEIIDKMIENLNGNIILIDIGGYFAPIIERLHSKFSDKIVGVVEDTENGHQRYSKLEKNLPVPVYSVARSKLKDFEDFLVGQSIVFSADVILRELGKLIQYLNCSVIGYGKIGKSIAYNLIAHGIKPNVYDINPIRRLEAHNQLCNIPPRDYILKNSDAIFCATGNKSLKIKENDFSKLKPGAFILSVTSADDELDLSNIDLWYKKKEISKYVIKYSGAYNYFYLVYEGNAVNFLHNAVVGDFIHLVRGEILYAAYQLLTINKQYKPGIYEMPEEIKEKIAKTWLWVFIDSPYGVYG